MVVLKEKWVEAAMTDDNMVAELLLRLKHAKTTAAENPAVLLPPSRWGVRQRRSRSSRFGGGGGGSLKKEAEIARGSPITPLSWSGSGSGGSASPSSAATADGFEETSRQAPCSTSARSGSKAFPASEIISESLKRKKPEMATRRTAFKEHNGRTVNLKLKLDRKSDRVVPDELVSKSNLKLVFSREQVPQKGVSDSGRRGNSEGGSERGLFLLPDLNMTPSDEIDDTDMMCGTS